MRFNKLDKTPFEFKSNFVYCRMMNAATIYLFNRWCVTFKMPNLYTQHIDEKYGWQVDTPTKYNLYVLSNFRKLSKFLKR